MPVGPLTLKQEKFCLEYVRNGGNASEAYRAAYNAEKMKPKTVNERASVLLSDNKVAARVKDLQDAITEAALIEPTELLREMAHMLRADPADAYTETGQFKSIHDIPRDLRRNIAAIKTRRVKGANGDADEDIIEVKFWDKQGTMDKLAKHLGVYEKDNRQKAPIMPLVDKDMSPEDAAQAYLAFVRGVEST